ncbi:hypothetical protein ACSNOK_25650 [Streptomyces sp. URMC 126]|uniref:hypothetical protein n=1 Tax=Streptomyces sp. URMC 126 TaxID=3423401 RepID=UPI003F1A5E54
MKMISRVLTAATASIALLTATAPAHAADGLNPVNAKRVPMAAPSADDSSQGLGGLLDILLRPNTIPIGQNNGFVIETLEHIL